MTHCQTKEIDLSIIIKTLNEDRNIGRCLKAIFDSLQHIQFEVIVADSGSTDRTIEIAKDYPVIIVQLANSAERSCGIGPQLGYQHSRGRFVLLLDADMVVRPDFVDQALHRMVNESMCGGLGGYLVEMSGTGYEYDQRQTNMTSPVESEVKWLDGGGLYRQSAIESVGYISNRNLHAYEEKELGLRLIAAKWRLYRLGACAADHFGHTTATLDLLWRRWRSGYAFACGESIRASLGKPYFMDMVRVHKTLVVCLLFQLFALLSLLIAPWTYVPVVTTGLMGFLAVLAQTFRKNGLKPAFHSLMYTNVFAVGLLRGLVKSPVDPATPIESVVISNNFGLQ